MQIIIKFYFCVFVAISGTQMFYRHQTLRHFQATNINLLRLISTKWMMTQLHQRWLPEICGFYFPWLTVSTFFLFTNLDESIIAFLRIRILNNRRHSIIQLKVLATCCSICLKLCSSLGINKELLSSQRICCPYWVALFICNSLFLL